MALQIDKAVESGVILQIITWSENEELYKLSDEFTMNSFFIEPPFKKIMLWGLPSYYEDFNRLGFWKHNTRCCMIRPTENFNNTLD
jgi:hypothetical protein